MAKQNLSRSKRSVAAYHHSFSIPASEEKLESWVRHQSHLAHSIRRLICWYVKNFGATDTLCENLDEPLGVTDSAETTHKIYAEEKHETIAPCNPFGRIY